MYCVTSASVIDHQSFCHQSIIAHNQWFFFTATTRGVAISFNQNVPTSRSTKSISNECQRRADVGDVVRARHTSRVSRASFRYVGYGVWRRERKTTLSVCVCVCGTADARGRTFTYIHVFDSFPRDVGLNYNASQRIAPADVRVEASPSITLSRSHYIALIIRVFIMSSANSAHLESRNRRRCVHARACFQPTLLPAGFRKTFQRFDRSFRARGKLW